jgi:hypothetical protein
VIVVLESGEFELRVDLVLNHHVIERQSIS